MKKLKIALLIAVLLPAQAYSLDIAGKWHGKGDGMVNDLVVKPNVNGYHATLATAWANGCTGNVEGDAVLTDSTLKITGNDSDADAICTINIKFSGKKASIEDSENCNYYHGASCDFYGDLKKKK
jgi:hypothetical protein